MTYTAPNVSTAIESQALGRLRWRCRRGMRELDVVFQRYLDNDYASAPETERRAFEALLEQQDPQLLAYLMGRELPSDPDQVHVVAKLSHARS
jgi:antitoxin CptB